MPHSEAAMAAYAGIEPGGTREKGVARRWYASATRAAWLDQLQKAGFVVREGEAPHGSPWVHSVEPTAGDPQLLAVWIEGDAGPWWVDRRTMRVNRQPIDSALEVSAVLEAADLADRVQLELGRPVSLEWFAEGDRLCISDLQSLDPRVGFTNASFRLIAPLMAAPGTLSPLSVDMLGQALLQDREGSGEPLVRRIYARAYRRIDAGAGQRARRTEHGRVGREVLRAVRLARDLALPTAELGRFRRWMAQEMLRFDDEDLTVLDTEDLADSLSARVALVVQTLSLLERTRQSTLAHVPLSQVLVGPVGRGQLAALAEPLATPGRRAAHDRLVALGHALMRDKGRLDVPDASDSASLRRRWSRARRTLGGTRVAGMDVRPGPCGDSDEALLHALHEARSQLKVAPEQRRREAEREMLEAAAEGGWRRAGVARIPTRWVLASLRRLARTKGILADALARSLLRVREAALEAGRRLYDEGVLPSPEDVFYLQLDELLQALQGELGAYAARSRFRREDDQRWRHFEPPMRIGGRRGPSSEHTGRA